MTSCGRLVAAAHSTTGSDDVVQVVKHAFNVLRGRAPNQGPAILNQRNALWLLDHLVGDMHQQLHVGAIYFDGECAQVVDPSPEDLRGADAEERFELMIDAQNAPLAR